MKGAERLIYAVVGTRGGGGGGGGVKCEERASGVALACGFGGVCLACGFRACRFCLSVHYMIGGLFGVVKGGFWGICRRMQDGGGFPPTRE